MSKRVRRRTRIVKDVVAYLIILMFLIFFIFPIFWIFITSLKLPIQVFGMGVIPFVQFDPTLARWYSQTVVESAGNIKALSNSLIIGLASATIATFLGSMAGYALARHEFKRIRNVNIITWFVLLRILPPIALALPFYALMLYAGLLDTQLSIVLLHSVFFLPYTTLVTRDAFKQLPIEIEESAMVDGCSRIQTFRKISLPLIAPALAALFILTFAFSWNEYLFAFVLSSREAITIPVHLAGSLSLGTLSVRGLLAIIPPVVLSMLIQRYIVSGLTMGAVRES